MHWQSTAKGAAGVIRVCWFWGMKLLGTLMIVTCARQAQSPDLKSVSGYPRMVQKQVTAWIERAAEKMPEQDGSKSLGQHFQGNAPPSGLSEGQHDGWVTGAPLSERFGGQPRHPVCYLPPNRGCYQLLGARVYFCAEAMNLRPTKLQSGIATKRVA